MRGNCACRVMSPSAPSTSSAKGRAKPRSSATPGAITSSFGSFASFLDDTSQFLEAPRRRGADLAHLAIDRHAVNAIRLGAVGLAKPSLNEMAGASQQLFNAYFDRVVPPIIDGGGQVLKFTGDAGIRVLSLPDAGRRLRRSARCRPARFRPSCTGLSARMPSCAGIALVTARSATATSDPGPGWVSR